MVSAPAWPPRPDARFCPAAAPVAASGCRPDGWRAQPGQVAPQKRAEVARQRRRRPLEALMARLETLKQRTDFLRLKGGASWSTSSFVLQASPSAPCPGTGSTTPRFGFTVSDRSVRETTGAETRRAGAVVRNRARRRLKEAVRMVAHECAHPGFDYVVIGRRPALTMDFAVLVQTMREAFASVHTPRRRRTERKPGAAKATEREPSR